MANKKYFYGNEISAYGLENGYVDYAALAKSFDGVLNNSIMEKTCEIGYWEQESGFIDNSDEIDELQEQLDELEEKYDEFTEEIEELVNEYDPYSEDSLSIKAKIHAKEKEQAELQDKIAKLESDIQDLEYEQDNSTEIYQYYIVDDNGAEILKNCNEIVFYNEELDMYVWGVTHYGTSWDYVLTDIKIDW